VFHLCDDEPYGRSSEGSCVFKKEKKGSQSKQVQGPAGAVFRATKLAENSWSPIGPRGETGQNRYEGNALSDAQVAVGHVIKFANLGSNLKASQINAVNQYFVGAYMAEEIFEWTASNASNSNLDLGKFNLKCNGDAMSHHNKGIMGLRLEFLERPRLSQITVKNLHNSGGLAEDPCLCAEYAYQGNDAYGVRITNSKQVDWQQYHKDSTYACSGLTAGAQGRTGDFIEESIRAPPTEAQNE
jgi:hypothetical protein